MKTRELCDKWGLTLAEVEGLREQHAGRYLTTVRDDHGNIKYVGTDHNIVTNEGLDHVLETELGGGTQITTWRVALTTSTTAPAAGMTYATPTYTEITSTSVTNTVRPTWDGGATASQSIDNSTGPAIYTASTTITARGAALVGGAGTSVIANTTNAGTLYSYAKFATSKSLTNTDTIEITYTFTAADDAV